jgi:iron complex outermembrane recepter protein
MFKSMMMAVIGCLLSLYANAQFSISGTVRDRKSNQPLVGATVQMDESKRVTVTDEFGKFTISRISAGEYSLTIKFLGFEEKTEKVTIPMTESIEVELNESSLVTDEVIVYATRANENTPTTFSTITQQSLQKQNFGQDMPYLLNWTPSVVTTSDGGTGVGYTGLRIRGSDATRVNVTINGIPYNDSESQVTYWVDIPDVASSTKSVQIQRGVGSSTNGAGSFGGSVNVQTLVLQAEPYAEVTTSGGSFGTHRLSIKAGTGLINNRWAFDGRVSKIKSDGYVDRASSDLDSYYLSGGFYNKNTIVKFITFGGHEKTYQSWNGVDAETMKANRTFNSAGALYDANYNVIRYHNNEVDDYRQDHYQFHLTQKINDYWNVAASLHYTYGRGFYEQYKQDKKFIEYGLDNVILTSDTIKSGDFIVRKWLDNKFYGTTFSLNYERNKTALVIGGAFNRYGDANHFGEIIWAQYASNSQIGHRYYQGKSQKDDFSMYTKLNYNFSSSINGFIDLQFRAINYKTAGIKDDLDQYDVKDEFNFFNPKAGLSYTLPNRDILYASYALANREPNRTDYIESEVKPKSEHLENLEIGWRKSATRYNFELNYYLMNYTNQLVLTGNLDNVGNPIRANVGKSYRTGIELSGIVRISKQLSLGANGTWSASKNQDYVIDPANLNEKKNTSIILSPNWIAGSQLSYNIFSNLQLTLLSKFVGKQYLDNSESDELSLPSYFVNDARCTYDISPKGMKNIAFSVLVNNLFDIEYSSNGYAYGTTPYFYPQAGRNFLAMVTLKF